MKILYNILIIGLIIGSARFFQKITGHSHLLMIALWLALGLVLCFYIYELFKSNMSRRLLFMVIPMAALVLLPMFYNILYSDGTIVDDDLLFQMDSIHKILNKKLFVNDAVVNFNIQNYPVMYVYLSAFLVSVFNTTVAWLSKLYSLVGAFLIPFLFFLLSYSIFKDREIAFLSGLFSFTMPWVFKFIMTGLPRLFGLILFLCGMSIFFYYLEKPKRTYVLISAVVLISVYYAHYPYFLALAICFIAMWGLRLTKQSDIKRELKNIFLFCVTFLIFTMYRLAQMSKVSYTTWSYLRNIEAYNTRRLAMHLPRLFPQVTRPLNSIFSFEDNILTEFLYGNLSMATDLGYIVLFFVVVILIVLLYRRTPFDYKQQYLFISIGGLIIAMILGFYIDWLAFLQPIHLLHVIALLIYIYGIFLMNLFCKHYLKYRMVAVVMISFVLIQPLFHSLATSKMIMNIKPSLLQVARWIKLNTKPDVLVVCPIELGDCLRAYSTRSVSSSDQIGGFVPMVKEALPIYKQQLTNATEYIKSPLECAVNLNASYVILTDKSKENDDIRFEKVFSNDDFCIYKRIR